MRPTRQGHRDSPHPGSGRREYGLLVALSAWETRSGCRTEGRHGLRQREAVISNVNSRGTKRLNLNLNLSLELPWALLVGDALLELGHCRRHVAPTCRFSHGTRNSTQLSLPLLVCGAWKRVAASDMDGRCDVPLVGVVPEKRPEQSWRRRNPVFASGLEHCTQCPLYRRSILE